MNHHLTRAAAGRDDDDGRRDPRAGRRRQASRHGPVAPFTRDEQATTRTRSLSTVFRSIPHHTRSVIDDWHLPAL
ncbi:hypothetical protein D3H59_27045 [Micromonospora endophytica]|nr:hypothetical protein D3H59_27045 [Micromonospora endophytica]